jgi:hypothetical protein
MTASVRSASVLSARVVMASMCAPKPCASRATWSVTGVSPEPEMMTSPSPMPIEGAVAPPTACASKPVCMRRIATICATSPERPWPEQNQRRLRSVNRAAAPRIWSLETADNTWETSSRTASQGLTAASTGEITPPLPWILRRREGAS